MNYHRNDISSIVTAKTLIGMEDSTEKRKCWKDNFGCGF